jgi:putative nucleotidyltransferase with HDIG domain
MDKSTALKKLERIRDLPTLPEIAMQVNRMLQEEEITIERLCETIEKDQAIVSRLLKLVNSAFFGLRSRVNTLSEAMAMLGFNSVRNVVVSVSIIEAFAGKTGDFDMKSHWKHSIATAMTAKKLSELTRLGNPEMCFLSGLLHDIGKIVLYQHFKEQFQQILDLMNRQNVSFIAAENEADVLDHARVGAYLAERWQLSRPLINTIKYHHQCERASSDQEMVMVVHTADVLSNAFLAKTKNRKYISELDQDAAGKMKTAIQSIKEWLPGLANEITSACRFFMGEEDRSNGAQDGIQMDAGKDPMDEDV